MWKLPGKLRAVDTTGEAVGTAAADPLKDQTTLELKLAIKSVEAAILAGQQQLRKDLSPASSERRLNNVWEYTQSVIAVFVVVTTCTGVLALSMYIKDDTARLPPEWWTIVGLVIGFYFGRVRPPGLTATRPPRSTDKLKPPDLTPSGQFS
jgi:hypothetical protein